ncbi:MAG: BAX inhibitor (BI)-1/YccA family protein, partial [Faecalibacterium prausnitzii]|nr:BAX inhibitor (BI)-1/YccA family protein [Faecalibacterium prausnitzii]
MDYNNYDRGYAEPSMSASDYMTRTYRWMAGGLLVTFAMAYITAT